MTREDVRLEAWWIFIHVVVAFFWVPVAAFYLLGGRWPPSFRGMVCSVVKVLATDGEEP